MNNTIFGDIEYTCYRTMKYLFIPIILSLLLVGCQSISQNQIDKGLLNWNYDDLRLLDPIDAKEPDQDLIAFYSRINNRSFQIRLDFLDLNTYQGKDIYIPLDTNPGGATQIKTDNNGTIKSDIQWDYLIKIPDSGKIEVINDQLFTIPGVELFIVFDSLQDRMVISLNKNALPIYYGKTKMQVIITPSNQNIVSDKSEPFLIDAPSPSRAKVLFAFWNTFNSITPSQTLRSWAGAHAGPMSSRHGLRYLIDAAAQNKSTIFLLDLLTPDNVSALDYIKVLSRIQILAKQGFLALPDVGSIETIAGTGYILNPVQQDNPITKLDFYKIWQINNNLKNINLENKNEFLLFLNKLLLINDKLNGFGYNDYAKYNYTKNDCELLPFPTNIGTVNRSLGISVNCKILLLSYAMSQPTTPLILGGDFSKSMFGDPELSTAVFTYINSHPWIQVISINDLINSRALLSSGPLPYQESTPYTSVNQQNTNISGKPNTTKIQNMVHDALLQSPNNQLTALAWKVFIDLTQSASQQLWALKANYVGQIGLILTAAKWAENPGLKIACNTDLDYDGKNECILANDTIIAIIEPDGGYIPFVFAKDAQGIHQIIGPTWEFVVGLSDPSSWNPDLGIRGDSAQMLGAFQDTSDNWNSYNVDLLKGKLEMYGNNIGMHKSIAIYPNRLHVDILNQNKSHSISYIPMVIDPWFRYTLGWGDYYFSKNEPFIIQWGITSGEKVDILATNPIKVFSFNDSRSALAYPEDPNYDYSQGHYLPYPMSVANLITTENYSVDIIINP